MWWWERPFRCQSCRAASTQTRAGGAALTLELLAMHIYRACDGQADHQHVLCLINNLYKPDAVRWT